MNEQIKLTKECPECGEHLTVSVYDVAISGDVNVAVYCGKCDKYRFERNYPRMEVYRLCGQYYDDIVPTLLTHTLAEVEKNMVGQSDDKDKPEEPKTVPFYVALKACIEDGKKIARLDWNGNTFKPAPSRIQRPKDMVERIEYNSIMDLTFIKLSKGEVAVADGSDFDRLSAHLWTTGTGGYAYYTDYTDKQNPYTMKMTTYLIGKPQQGFVIDHINGDRLDNRRCNLRVVSDKENIINSKKKKGGTSVYKGVSWDSTRNKWISSIQEYGKTIHIGRFDTEEECAKAYDKAVWLRYGNCAKLNFPDEPMPPRMYVWFVKPGTHDDKHLGYFAMKTPTGDIVIGWLASQTDLYSDQWIILDD